MNFDASVRQHAQVLLDALASHVATAARTELDELRAAVDRQASALKEALPHPDQSNLLERLVQELSSAALKQAETMATRARLDAEKVAQAELAGARAQGQAHITSVQKAAETEVAATRAESQAQIAALKKIAETELASARTEGQTQVAAVQTVNAGLLESIDAARLQAQKAQTSAQIEVERIRKELEARVAQAQTAHADVAKALAQAQHDVEAQRSEAEAQRSEVEVQRSEVEAQRSEVQAQTTSLEHAHAHILTLEQERTHILLERDDARRRLEAETRRASEMGKALEAAAQKRPSVGEQGTTPDVSLLDRVGAALRSIDVATSAGEILETVIEQLGHDFARAAMFLIGPSSFRGWRGRGFGPTNDISSIVMPRTMDSLLARAVADRKLVAVASGAGDQPLGLSGSPVGHAVALPVFAGGRVIAVAYAEGAEKSSPAAAEMACRIAQMLIDHSNVRFTAKRRTSSQSPSQAAQEIEGLAVSDLGTRPTKYSAARQARRFRIQDGIEISLDGFAGFLVDLSTVGAQVLSSLAVGPNRLVRVTLHTEEGAIACKGRVVWAALEQARETAAARYRAGVQFTEVDLKAVQAFLARHGELPKGTLEVAKLKDTA